MTDFTLTVDNYHSLQANQHTMSSHQWGNWMECPARTFASLNGAWGTGDKVAFLVGGYIDVMLLTPLDSQRWFDDHKQAMIEMGLLSKAKNTRGAKLATVIKADNMIERAKHDPVFMDAISGESQLIMTAELFGHPWRCMVDSIKRDIMRITDLKSTKSTTSKSWFNTDTIFNILDGTTDQKENLHRGLYFDEFNYFRQFAIYREIAAKYTRTDPDDWTLLMAALSKEKPTDANPNIPDWRQVDLELRIMNDEDALMRQLDIVEEHSEQIWKWKLGEEPAPACGKCAFCIAHKQLSEPTQTRSVVRY